MLFHFANNVVRQSQALVESQRLELDCEFRQANHPTNPSTQNIAPARQTDSS